MLTALARPRRRPAEQAEHCAGTAALAAAPAQATPDAPNLPPAGHSQLNSDINVMHKSVAFTLFQEFMLFVLFIG